MVDLTSDLEISKRLEQKVDKILEILKFDSDLWKCTYESEHANNIKDEIHDFKITLEDIESSLDSIRGSIIDVESTLSEVDNKIKDLDKERGSE